MENILKKLINKKSSKTTKTYDDLPENKFSEPRKYIRLWLVLDNSHLNSTSNLITVL